MEPIDRLGIEARWPELFEGLSEQQRDIVSESFAVIWHAGWERNREDVKNLTDLVRGTIDKAEYDRRVSAKAQRVSSVNRENQQ